MNNVASLISEVRALGARIWSDGSWIELDAPADFPDLLVEQLKQQKPEVLAALACGHSAPTDTVGLLTWASELAEGGLVFAEPVRFVEAPLRTVTTQRVSWYARQYLAIIASSRLHQATDGWGSWTPHWWREREQEALDALQAMRQALEELAAEETTA